MDNRENRFYILRSNILHAFAIRAWGFGLKLPNDAHILALDTIKYVEWPM